MWDKIAAISGRELDDTNNSRIIMANGSTDTVVGKVNLPITIDNTTKMCEVRVVIDLDTEMILGLDSQGKFDNVFASRSKPVFMPDSMGKHYPLKHWLTQMEGCSGITDLHNTEETRLRVLLEREIPPEVEGQLKPTHLVEHVIDIQVHAPIKERCRIVSPKVQEAMYLEIDRLKE